LIFDYFHYLLRRRRHATIRCLLIAATIAIAAAPWRYAMMPCRAIRRASYSVAVDILLPLMLLLIITLLRHVRYAMSLVCSPFAAALAYACLMFAAARYAPRARLQRHIRASNMLPALILRAAATMSFFATPP